MKQGQVLQKRNKKFFKDNGKVCNIEEILQTVESKTKETENELEIKIRVQSKKSNIKLIDRKKQNREIEIERTEKRDRRELLRKQFKNISQI